MAGPLDGIMVLDFTWALAGPYCTMILCDLGAEVIKIERPELGDRAREAGPFVDGISSYFFSLNRGKKSIALDLKLERAKQIVLELVKKADVVVENYSPGTMKKLGLDYEVIKEHNPRIIYAACSGFGQYGPYASRHAVDIIVQGMGGMMSITGEPDGRPLRTGASIGDIGGGVFTAIGILGALHERSRSGLGQMIDVSMLDCQVAILENAFARYFATGKVPERFGPRHPVGTPHQSFQTKDGYIVLAMAGTWPLFCAAIGRVDLIDDERFADGYTRTLHYDELEPIMNQAMKTKTTDEWLKELSEVGIPCGPVNTIDKAAVDPQLLARQMIVEVPHRTRGKMKVTNTPVKLSRTPGGVKGAAPEVGEHTPYILKGYLGITDEDLEELKAAKVI